MDMLCTFIKQPNVVLLFRDCIKKYKIDFPYALSAGEAALYSFPCAGRRGMCRLSKAIRAMDANSGMFLARAMHFNLGA